MVSTDGTKADPLSTDVSSPQQGSGSLGKPNLGAPKEPFRTSGL
jgi:hypothetical protein